jgi:autotransporter-associated beta strand protein
MPNLSCRFLAAWLSFVSLVALSSGQVATFTWTGNAATVLHNSGSASIDTAANWSGNVAPPQNGSASTLLTFGASAGITSSGDLDLDLPYLFEVVGLTFTAPMPSSIFFLSDDDGPLSIGGSGITFNGSGSDELKLGRVELTASQTWTINGGAIYVNGKITQAGGAATLTQAGTGALVLNSATSDFTGGVNVQGGTLYVGSSSTGSGGAVTAGPVGTGTLTLGNNTALQTNTYANVTLHNNIVLGNNVTFGYEAEDNSLTLAGNITPLNTATTVRLGAEDGVFFSGALTNVSSNAATSFRFTGNESLETFTSSSSSDSYPVAVLSGTNTYTGGTIADGAGVIFLTNAAIPATGAISAVDGGYIGVGENGGMATVIGQITNKAGFDGVLGFDTHPSATTTASFGDAIDLTGFTNDSGGPTSGFWGLGSLTKAILTGTITPPTGGNYVFGGGEGTLFVSSNLTAATGVRVRSEFDEPPLTVWLQGNNSFTGHVYSDHSIVVFNSANALPTGSGYQMDSGAYVGYTEATGWTPAQFISRLNAPNYSSTSVLGFDSNATHGRNIADAVDLSSLANNIFIGTSTHVHLQSNAIKAPQTGQLSVTGVKGGWLSIDGALQSGNVTSLLVGNPDGEAYSASIVELSGASTFTGGTTFKSGYLLLSASSTSTTPGTVTSGPLGTGTLTIDNYDYYRTPTIAAGASSVTVHNNISFQGGSAARFGIPAADADDDYDPAKQLQSYATNALTLAGNLSGSSGSLSFVGDSVFTLSGNNAGLHTGYLAVGSTYQLSNTRVVATHANALGDNSSSIVLGYGADLSFTDSNNALSTNFVIGNIWGGTPLTFDTGNRSYIALDDGDKLTINQTTSGLLYASIGGVPTSYSGNVGTTTTASVEKTGGGTLTLAGENTFSGGLTISGGTVVANHSQALGSGTVTLAGGSLQLASGVSLNNTLAFTGSNNVLTGSGTFNSSLTVATGLTLSPGNSPGTMTFTNGLTLDGGGALTIDIANLYGSAGTDWDLVHLSNGLFAMANTNTAGDRFTITINSLTSSSGGTGMLGSNSDAPASLMILSTPQTITGFDANAFTLVTNFTSPTPGVFSLSVGGNANTALMLNFTPVPEPSTYALLGLGLALVGWQLRRRHVRR